LDTTQRRPLFGTVHESTVSLLDVLLHRTLDRMGHKIAFGKRVARKVHSSSVGGVDAEVGDEERRSILRAKLLGATM
jgi:hypothetical protein